MRQKAKGVLVGQDRRTQLLPREYCSGHGGRQPCPVAVEVSQTLASTWLGKAAPLIIAAAALTGCDRAASVQNSSQETTTARTAAPSVPPPHFRVYRAKVNTAVVFVVPPGTNDEQIKSLLWLFREKVRSRRFKELGVTQPTVSRDERFAATGGHDSGYRLGIFEVYRSENCAAEEFSNADPCGEGGHWAARYRWGVLAGQEGDSDKDDATIRLGGRTTEVFSYKTNWQPPKSEAEKREEVAEAAKQNLLCSARGRYVSQIQASLRNEGFEISVTDFGEKLIFASDVISDTSTRVQFLSLIRKSNAGLQNGIQGGLSN